MHIGKKDEPDKTPEQKELERRVDAMMDPKLPEPSEAAPEPQAEPDKPAIERISVKASKKSAKPAKAVKTAPELPSAGKKIMVSDASDGDAATKPLSIDKLDQLTKSIVGDDEGKDKGKDDKAGPPKDEEEPAAEPETDEVPSGEDDKTADDDTDGQGESEKAAKEPDPEDDTGEDTDLDDVRTEQAVDDIVAHEGDVMLAVADATAAKRNRASDDKAGKSHKGISAFIWFLVALIAVLAIAISVLMATGGSLPKL